MHCVREQPTDLAYDRLLYKAESYEIPEVEYNYGKESRQDSLLSSSTVSTSINAVPSIVSYNRYSSLRTCGRCSLIHYSSGHCPDSDTQCGKCSCPSHWQHMCHTQTPPRSPSRRGDNQSMDRYEPRSCIRGQRNQYQRGRKKHL